MSALKRARMMRMLRLAAEHTSITCGSAKQYLQNRHG
jgi:hypothetical protein